MQLLPPLVQTSKIQAAGVFLTGLASLVALLYYGRAVCITLVVSVILSYILEPFVGALMRIRLPRGLAALIVCTIGILLLYLLGLGLFSQLASFTDDLPAYSQRVNEVVDSIAGKLERTEQNMYMLAVPKRFQDPARLQPDPTPPSKRRKRTDPAPPAQVPEVRIKQERSSVFNSIYSYVSSFYNVLLMVSFVPFLVYFMLSWRDKIRLRFLSIFDGTERLAAGRAWENIADMARAYVVGNFLLGLLLSFASCIVFWSWHLPYWVLIGFISGFLSLVPYVGFPLAVVPPLAAALLVYDGITPYLGITAIVGLAHLLAMNLLYPAFVGARVHLNPLAVTVALMFWGTIWGGLGLVLAIPMTAGLKAILDSIAGLKPWSRLLGD